MKRINSRELKSLLGFKRLSSARRWAKTEGIQYMVRQNPINKGNQYWYERKPVMKKIKQIQRRKKFISSKEVAQLLKINLHTVYNWVNKGYLSVADKEPNGGLLFDKKKVMTCRPKRKWTLWQEKSLIKYRNQRGLFHSQIAERLGKTTSAVNSKIRYLSEKIREFYSLSDVAVQFRTDVYKVRRWVRSGKLKAKEVLTSPRGQRRYKIWQEQIIDFMKNYPELWKSREPLVNFLDVC